MNKSILGILFLGLFIASCGDNAGGNKSIFSTKEAESGVYSKDASAEHETEVEEEHSVDSTKNHSTKEENKNETVSHSKDSIEDKKENK